MTTAPVDDHALKSAWSAFKGGDPDADIPTRRLVTDATHTARTGHERFDGRRVPTVTVYFDTDVVDVTDDHDPEDDVDVALQSIVDKFDLTPLRYDESQNAVVFARDDDV